MYDTPERLYLIKKIIINVYKSIVCNSLILLELFILDPNSILQRFKLSSARASKSQCYVSVVTTTLFKYSLKKKNTEERAVLHNDPRWLDHVIYKAFEGRR